MGLVTWFHNQKIQRKLILSNVFAITLALLPVVLVMFSYEFYAMRQAALQEIRVQADIVSDNAAAAMAFGDEKAAYEALTTLKAAPDMLRSSLLLPDGKVLASYQRVPGTFVQTQYTATEKSTEVLTWNQFSLQKQVYLKDNFVGTLILEFSLKSFYHRIKLYFSVIATTALVALGLSLWAAIRLKNSIIKPLSLLMDSVNHITDQQDYSVRPEVSRPDEIGDLSRAFNNMMNNLQERDERLQDLAFYDAVTGLPNRNFFKERILRVVKDALRYKRRAALMFIDLDDFKVVNDTLGHHVGDDLLHVIGLRLRTLLRNNDLVFRIGGDEFAVILENVEDVGVPIMLAEKIIESVAKPSKLLGQNVVVGASIGISLCPDYVTDAAGLLKTADAAMYVAKSRSKNTYHLYNEAEQHSG